MIIFAFPFGLMALWDLFTTVFGTWSSLQQYNPFLGLMISILLAIFILTILFLGFQYMLENAHYFSLHKRGLDGLEAQKLLYIIFLFVFPISFVYDFYTSYLGNKVFFFEGAITPDDHLISRFA
ncbi:hypothetical protein IQ260_10945 [Leptolyngbya cf. ectocarpi LEGE 11479]|uniref:Uncharacterized protein n=1 Tax=Leptolyngbya cf. ectocarpi LEGE 11479 TaxID=1828722 RepID=A0A928X4N9_LEPEC|nr:hypothetical protein [Leptolyngbya ectocarpi]MBE9067173.1 hypothetical protein [Leptolyngbya cf. ectocarpi LEGE 11479]